MWYNIKRAEGETNLRKEYKNGLVVQLVRTLACHARGRGFEPHPGRQLYSTAHAGMAQSVEHILGKDEVTSSILVTSSKGNARSQDTVDGHFGLCGTFFRPHPFSQFSVKGCGLFMLKKITLNEQSNDSRETSMILGIVLVFFAKL